MHVDLSKIQLGFIPASGTNLFCDQKKAPLCVCVRFCFCEQLCYHFCWVGINVLELFFKRQDYFFNQDDASALKFEVRATASPEKNPKVIELHKDKQVAYVRILFKEFYHIFINQKKTQEQLKLWNSVRIYRQAMNTVFIT